MRWGILSDIHGNYEALEATLGALEKEHIDRYLCPGDIVGYGADPAACIARIKRLNPLIVAGNHDWASVGLFSLSSFNLLAKQTVLWTEENLNAEDKRFLKGLKLLQQEGDLTLVHGTLQRPEQFEYMLGLSPAQETFALLKSRICFVGHTHRPAIFIQENAECRVSSRQKLRLTPGQRYIVNAGSVGQPRDGNPQACYVVYDSDKQELEIKSVSYDIRKAQEKIVNAGLPRVLADRLALGR